MASPGVVEAIDDRRAAGAALLTARRRLARAGIRTAALDAEVLLAHVLSSTREGLLAHPERRLTSAQARRFSGPVSKRASRMPVAHLTGAGGSRSSLTSRLKHWTAGAMAWT